jgi:hypothetical protein
MTRKQRRDVAASVRDRLLNLARERGEDFQLVLTRYAVERLLYRLSVSMYRDQFLLKGAMLFLVWKGQIYRPTRDLDLLGNGESDVGHVEAVFREICKMPVENDGLEFLGDTIGGVRIREEGGVRGGQARADRQAGPG